MIILQLTAAAVAPWVAIGLTMTAMIVAGATSLGKKADRSDVENVWKGVNRNQKDIADLRETKGEMRAYVKQLREMVAELKKMNGK